MSTQNHSLLDNEVLSGIHAGSLNGSVTIMEPAITRIPSVNASGDGNAIDERGGLSSAEAESRLRTYGFNELPTIEVPLWRVFFVQFTGTMPYMLELACIIALAVEDWVSFAIILSMLCCNGYLGFHEELKAKQSLVSITFKNYDTFDHLLIFSTSRMS